MENSRNLTVEMVEGEVSLVIDYVAGESEALRVLQSAMRLIEGLDALDHALLSSIDTSLEPVSILNDVQHSSLKLFLARALRSVPDDAIASLDWKKWVGGLLVKGKHKLLSKLDADDATLQKTLNELTQDYLAAPNNTAGYMPPTLADTRVALTKINIARASLPNSKVLFQTELGDIDLPVIEATFTVENVVTQQTYKSTGRGLFKVKSPDMLGNAQWQIILDGKTEKARISHEGWLKDYHARRIVIAPHDSLDADFEQEISYDENQIVISKVITLTYIHSVVLPPENMRLFD